MLIFNLNMITTMDENKKVDLLREALTGALDALTRVYGYAVMDDRTLKKVISAMEDAESTLQRTD